MISVILLFWDKHQIRLFPVERMRILIFIIFCLFSSVMAADQELPILGENASLNLSNEAQLGQGLYDHLKQGGYLIEDPLLSRYLSDMGESLLAHLDLRVRDYHFFLVKDNSVNAFAAPGGFIGVNAGLIALTHSEDELASVIAHEIAHVELRHTMQMIEKSQTFNAVSALSILAAILLSSQDPDAASAMIYGGVAGTNQAMVNFTRSNEYEADRVGVELINKSQYNPEAMADFMLMLQQKEQSGAIANIEYIRTHPISSNRVAEIRARVKKSKTGNMKKTKYFSRYPEFKDYLSYVYPGPSKQQQSSAFYLALELMKKGLFKEASERLSQLRSKDPDSIWVSYAQAESLVFQSRYKEALKIYQSLMLLYPDDLAITIKLVNTLIELKEYDKALEYAQRVFIQNEQRPEGYQMLVQLYKLLDRPNLQQLAEADYHWYNGNREQAIKLYKELINKGLLDVVNEQRVNDKLAENIIKKRRNN
jgi:beta-barrel assembly-enhancing protease